MKNSDLALWTGTVVAVALVVLADMGKDLVEYELAEVGKTTVSTASLVGAACIWIVGFLVARVLRANERRKNGLRGSWESTDFDELEERVRKLEEKKDPEEYQ